MENAIQEKVLNLVQTAQSMDAWQEGDEIKRLFEQARSLVDPDKYPKQWAALHIPFGNCLMEARPDDAIQAFEEALNFFTREIDGSLWRFLHSQIGNIWFVKCGVDNERIEPAIEHLEFSVDTETHNAYFLGFLYQMRIRGDRMENWTKRVRYMQMAADEIDQLENAAAWAKRNNDLADAWQEEPHGNFAHGVEKRLSGYLASQHAINVNDGEIWINTHIGLSESYSARALGSVEENVKLSRQNADIALAACDVSTSIETHRMALQGAAQCLVIGNNSVSDSDFSRARSLLTRARELVNEQQQPEAAADIERSIALLLLAKVTAGKSEYLDELVSCTRKSRQLLGDSRPNRSLVVCRIEGEALFDQGNYAQAVDVLEEAVELALSILNNSVAISSRLESVHNMGDVSAMLCQSYILMNQPGDAVSAWQFGKGAFWNIGNEILEVESLGSKIPIGGALLLASFTLQHGYVLIVTERGIKAVRLPEFNRAKLLKLQRGENSEVKLGGWLYDYFTLGADMASLGSAIRSLGADLYKRAWQPLIGGLEEMGVNKGAELVWCHDSGSDSLPMHSAWIETAGEVKHLIDDYSIRYSPSLRVLKDIEQTNLLAGGAVIVSDPNENLDTEELENYWISMACEDAPVTVLRGKQADRAHVIDHLTTANVMHFSCHGVFDIGDPWDSRLLLTAGEALTMRSCFEVMQSGAPGMVTLSACETAVTKVTSLPNESLGFPSTFLYAGTRTVLATQWRIPDRVAALTIGRYYANLSSGNTPAEALCRSQFWLRDLTAAELRKILGEIKNSDSAAADVVAPWRSELFKLKKESCPYGLPSYWAAFALFGN